jgi:hypothetical protein
MLQVCELLDAGVQLADVALGLGLHQHAAQDPRPVAVRLDAGMAAGPLRSTIYGNA